jgi:hypothetical protein
VRSVLYVLLLEPNFGESNGGNLIGICDTIKNLTYKYVVQLSKGHPLPNGSFHAAQIKHLRLLGHYTVSKNYRAFHLPSGSKVRNK